MNCLIGASPYRNARSASQPRDSWSSRLAELKNE
jgi:hypothetical protein